jgi:hypothetical protein
MDPRENPEKTPVIVNVLGTSEGGRGVNFQFPPWGWYGCFVE